jgi:hypothetical protein
MPSRVTNSISTRFMAMSLPPAGVVPAGTCCALAAAIDRGFGKNPHPCEYSCRARGFRGRQRSCPAPAPGCRPELVAEPCSRSPGFEVLSTLTCHHDAGRISFFLCFQGPNHTGGEPGARDASFNSMTPEGGRLLRCQGGEKTGSSDRLRTTRAVRRPAAAGQSRSAWPESSKAAPMPPGNPTVSPLPRHRESGRR